MMNLVIKTFLEDLRSKEIVNGYGEPMGTVAIDHAEELMRLLAIAVENECQCKEDLEDVLDRGVTFRHLHSELV